MSEFLNAMKVATNMTRTTNGAVTYTSTLSKVYDLFAEGAAMRGASEDDCMNLFAQAYQENPDLALKCLFYLRDIRGGQGERRFFRCAIHWLARFERNEMRHLIEFVPEFGRWDDLYALVDTGLEADMFAFVRKQLWLDLDSQTPSLLAKWLKSENTSSRESVRLGTKTRMALGLTSARYRKMLSLLRSRINIVETLMSQNRWDEIEFDKLPSKAGLMYKNAFARRDIIKAKYEKFMKDEKTTVNAGTLYPYDVVHQVSTLWKPGYYYDYHLNVDIDDVRRVAINKYWDNLADYFNGATLNALAVVDTSGSMTSGYNSKIAPIDVAIALGLYCADRAYGPFHGHFISFSSKPKLIATEGVDFCDKVTRIYQQNLCENTNIERTFDLVLQTAVNNHLTQDQLPQSLIVISDMQFDQATGYGYYRDRVDQTLFETIRGRWAQHGYTMPHLIFWNVNAASGGGNIPMKDDGNVTYVSGASPVILEQVLTGKTGQDLMLDKLNSERYAVITSIK